MYNGDRSRKINLVEHGFRLPSALDNRPMKFEEFIKVIDKTIYVSATPAAYELSISSKNVIRQIIRPTGLLDPQIICKKSKNQIDNLIENIKSTINKNEKILITTLTKRMSEDLTDYLKSLNFRAEYLHSEIDTLERVKILRGLRLNEFDILIGINLLREGLDLPEVSLVAVLDADKQGFLRSQTSLMQVAGRASRNINGKVLLYGDTISEAMNYLMEETKRRRKLQIDHNNKNNIIPKTIFKSQNEIKNTTIIANNSFDKILEFQNKIELSNIDLIETEDLVKKIRKKMLNYAKELKFEEAALLRDQLEKLELNKKGFKHE
jgi:excinuclease ABC subunit B